jgi:hypothetical protein
LEDGPLALPANRFTLQGDDCLIQHGHFGAKISEYTSKIR